jgi:hypothetical protein
MVGGRLNYFPSLEDYMRKSGHIPKDPPQPTPQQVCDVCNATCRIRFKRNGGDGLSRCAFCFLGKERPKPKKDEIVI